jgi:hypothetical protein
MVLLVRFVHDVRNRYACARSGKSFFPRSSYQQLLMDKCQVLPAMANNVLTVVLCITT